MSQTVNAKMQWKMRTVDDDLLPFMRAAKTHGRKFGFTHRLIYFFKILVCTKLS